MSKVPFYNRWDELTDEELERILDAAFRAVAQRRVQPCS